MIYHHVSLRLPQKRGLVHLYFFICGRAAKQPARDGARSSDRGKHGRIWKRRWCLLTLLWSVFCSRVPSGELCEWNHVTGPSSDSIWPTKALFIGYTEWMSMRTMIFVGLIYSPRKEGTRNRQLNEAKHFMVCRIATSFKD